MPLGLYEQVLGGLIGQAFGDAFAMPALLHPEDTWNHYGGWVSGFHPGPEGHPAHEGLPAARVTDDTQQAFALAESIIRDGAVTMEGSTRALLAWYESIGGDTALSVGPSTRRACRAQKRGADPNDPDQLFGRVRDLYDLVGSTLAAAGSVPSAFGILALAGGDPLCCARYATALSGDADTVAAMACAVAGSWKGAGAFSKKLVDRLRRANPELDLEGVAQGLTRLAERSLEGTPA